MTNTVNHRKKHQPDLRSTKPLFVVIAVVAGVLLAAHIALRLLLRIDGPPRPIESHEAGRPSQQKAVDFESMRRRKEAHLEQYGWVDRDRSIAHIPVSRAMEIVVREHAGAPADTGESGK